MHFLGMLTAVADHLRVWDASGLLDYNGLPFQQSQFRSNSPLDECGTQKNLFHFQANLQA